jgi:integrase
MTTRRWTITSDKFLSSEQVAALLDYLCRERDLALARGNNPQAVRDFYLLRGLLETGLRVSEFCSLVNSDFSGLKLVVRRGKGGKPRTVLLTRSTAETFKEWLSLKGSLDFSVEPSAPMFPSRYRKHYSVRGVQKRVKLIFSALGFPDHLSVHSLRHTYCSLLIASGKVGIGTVRDNMGHHSITITDLYTHAVGNLSDVELYPASSSHNLEKGELGTATDTPRSKGLVRERLSRMRKANFQDRVPKTR